MSKEQKAKEYAKQYDEYDWQLVSEQAYEEGWDEALKSQWIRVENKMPEMWQKVLVLIKLDEFIQVHTAMYFGEINWMFGDTKIIAWMPIPSFDNILENNKDVLKRLKDK